MKAPSVPRATRDRSLRCPAMRRPGTPHTAPDRVSGGLVAGLLAAALALGACAGSSEPPGRTGGPSDTRAPGTNPDLAREQSDAAAALVPDLLACRDPEPGTEPGAGAPLALALVVADPESRAKLGIAPTGDESAQVRALVDHLNGCGGREIELHVHDDYDLTDPVSLAGLCDDVVHDEHNDVVIARGIDATYLECAAAEAKLIQLGSASRAQLSAAAGRWVAIGDEIDTLSSRTIRTLADEGRLEPGSGVGILRSGAPGEQAIADEVVDALTGALGDIDAHVTEATVTYDDQLGCEGLREAYDAFRDAEVTAVVTLLDRACAGPAGLELAGLGAQWIANPLHDGTDDSTVDELQLAAGDAYDGMLAVTASPGNAAATIIPTAPPALGEACAAITAAEGEDYEYGIARYRSIEELCLAVLLATRGDLDALQAETSAEIALPLPDGRFATLSSTALATGRDLVYVQQLEYDCSCWQYVAGPISVRG